MAIIDANYEYNYSVGRLIVTNPD